MTRLQWSRIGSKTHPPLDLREQSLSGAQSSDGLSMADQSVGWPQMSLCHAALDQLLCDISCGERRQACGEGANKCNTNRLIIVTRSVGTLSSPTTTLVHLAVAADQKVVANVGPAIGENVERLNVAHSGRTVGRCVTSAISCVVNHYERSWTQWQHGGGDARPSAPLRSTDNVRAVWTKEKI